MNHVCKFATAAILAGCSGQTDDFVLSENEVPSEQSTSPQPSYGAVTEEAFVPQTYDEANAEFQRRFATPLSEQERAIVEDALIKRGADLSRVTFSGRMIVDNDTYTSADSILARPNDVIEKGTTILGNWLSPIDGINHTAPFSRMNGLNFETHRPYFGYLGRLAVVVPSTLVRDIVQLAVNDVIGAADDCISSSSIRVILKSDWDALQQGQREYV